MNSKSHHDFIDKRAQKYKTLKLHQEKVKDKKKATAWARNFKRQVISGIAVPNFYNCDYVALQVPAKRLCKQISTAVMFNCTAIKDCEQLQGLKM